MYEKHLRKMTDEKGPKIYARSPPELGTTPSIVTDFGYQMRRFDWPEVPDLSLLRSNTESALDLGRSTECARYNNLILRLYDAR